MPFLKFEVKVQKADGTGAFNIAYVGIITAALSPIALAPRSIVIVEDAAITVDVGDIFDLQGIDPSTLTYAWSVLPSLTLTMANNKG